MKEIVVTGCKGQLGSCIRELDYGLTDRFIVTYVDYDELDITDKKAVEEYFKDKDLHCIINCAAYTNVNKAEIEVEKARDVNVNGPKNLCDICEEKDALLIQISTDYVSSFSNYKKIGLDLINPVESCNIYGKTKCEAEFELCFKPKILIIRTSWLYSEYGNNFCKTIINKIKNGETCDVVDDQVGTPTYAMDLARYIIQMLNKKEFIYGVRNYSNEGSASWYDFAYAIEDIYTNGTHKYVKPRSTNNMTKDKVLRPYYSILDKSTTKRWDNVEIPYWRDSLKVCVERLMDLE